MVIVLCFSTLNLRSIPFRPVPSWDQPAPQSGYAPGFDKKNPES